MNNQLSSMFFSGLPIRIVIIDGGPWFSLLDICGALGVGVCGSLGVIDVDGERSITDNSAAKMHAVRDEKGGLLYEFLVVNTKAAIDIARKTEAEVARAFEQSLQHWVFGWLADKQQLRADEGSLANGDKIRRHALLLLANCIDSEYPGIPLEKRNMIEHILSAASDGGITIEQAVKVAFVSGWFAEGNGDNQDG